MNDVEKSFSIHSTIITIEALCSYPTGLHTKKLISNVIEWNNKGRVGAVNRGIETHLSCAWQGRQWMGTRHVGTKNPCNVFFPFPRSYISESLL